MKIGTFTFHSSYNFGSNLQAYALQQYILRISKEYNKDIDYTIVNLRTETQDALNDYKKNDNFIKKTIKKIVFGKKLELRQQKFENFINNYLNITKEYKNRAEIIDDNLSFDTCITGSDQIWNLFAYDFDWSYFLDGIKCRNKISYAVSAGPKSNEISDENKLRIKKLINNYNYISVREEGTKQFVSQFINKDIEINMDPTILLDKEEWESIIDDKKIVNEPYILYYSLRPSLSRTRYLKKISKKMNMRVVVANPSYKYDIIGGFVRKYESGPLEFLNLLKNADLVISSSFHGTIFSVILNVPFYSLNGVNDYRISTLLKTMELEDRMILENDSLDFIKANAYKIDFSRSNDIINIEKNKSKNYLIRALEIGDNDASSMR